MLERVHAYNDMAGRREYFSVHSLPTSPSGFVLSWGCCNFRSRWCMDFGISERSPIFAPATLGFFGLVPHFADRSRSFVTDSDSVSVLDRLHSGNKLSKRRTRRDTATATSRLVGNITRNMNPFPRLNARPR
jgi:hypothetical protein